MQHSDVRRVMEAVGSKRLPICPGDMIVFKASTHRLLVVACTTQDTDPTTGQHVWGLLSGYQKGWWFNERIDWIGFDTHWTIHRAS